MKKGNHVKLICDVDPYLKSGMIGIFQEYTKEGGLKVYFEGYPLGFGRTYGSKGHNAHLAPYVVEDLSVIDLLKEYIKVKLLI